jgi:hypothetical protein
MGSAIVCPDTGEAIPFSIKTGAKTVAQAWNHFVRVRCPHCGEPHARIYKEVYMEGALTGFQDDLALVLLDQQQRSRLQTKERKPKDLS